ncbi:MAG: hypothetical protein EBQ46_02210 [Actinobacteria bacterium]|nr:hypothetical protein [Actinomycetota bacterium]NCZ77203.1 hypothetical protein [Actinomycetota bacterium]
MLRVKALAQLLLGSFLLTAGISHLGSNRIEFQAQVPTYLPLDPDFVVVASGVVEIALGLLLIITLLIYKKYRRVVGLITAIFFILIFPGNINQYLNQIDAFGLDTDQKRLIRLFFQPPLVVAALWVSGAGSLVSGIITSKKR